MLVLDINDTEITLARDEEVLFSEPGAAIVTDSEPRFGHDALHGSRLNPRHAHNQFWQRLSADPITPSAPGVKNQADLVYKHLRTIKTATGITSDDPITVIVPSSTTNEQLSLLLGIAQEASLTFATFVDGAVAAGTLAEASSAQILIDMGWHRGIVTELTSDSATDHPQIGRGNVVEVQGFGLASLIEGWIDAVADQFVSETRFDPLRIAETEQQVFDQVLDAYSSRAGLENLGVTVDHNGDVRRVDVDSSAFHTKSQQRFEALSNHLNDAHRVAVTARAARIPGLVEHLRRGGMEVMTLPEHAAIDAARQHQDLLLQGESVRFIRQLPSSTTSPAPAETNTAARSTPTHLLARGVAIALGTGRLAREHPEYSNLSSGFALALTDAGFVLRQEPGSGVTVNGKTTSAGTLEVGDVIDLGDARFELIQVRDG